MATLNDNSRDQRVQYQQQQHQWFQQTANPNWNDAAYPPQKTSPNSTITAMSSYHKAHETVDYNEGRRAVRTPSPTPSELKELNSDVLDWKRLSNWRFWIRREWIWYYVIFFIVLVISILMAVFHKQIVTWLTPVTRWLHDLKFGWLVPIAILFVISFPPLFGHEIVAILCGIVWGLWVGFAIVCAGTFLGEVGNFYAFKYCCKARGEKLEKSKIMYACLAKVVREGGFKIALIARLSAIPGHFTTAVFSTCGMGILTFSIAAILSLPKQFITVYVGVILEGSGDGSQPDTKSKIISDVVLGISILITIGAMWYIFREMRRVKPQVIYERRKARQAKLEGYHNGNSDSTMSLNPAASDVNLPLHQRSTQYPFSSQYQYGSGQGPQQLYAPRPQQTNQYGYIKDDDVSSDESTSSNYQSQQAYPIPRQSTEVVGWDTGRQYQSRDQALPTTNYRTTSPQSHSSPAKQANPQSRAPPQLQPLQEYPSSRQQYNPQQNLHFSPTSTPTQSQYAIDVQPPTATSAAPHYSAPSQIPPPSQQTYHTAEPTDLTYRSYHTADGSEMRTG